MDSPLSASQESLRGRKVTDMTARQLLDWIDACSRMEKWTHMAKKGRKEWRQARAEAVAELQRRRLSTGNESA